jgi:hypothetical protein
LVGDRRLEGDTVQFEVRHGQGFLRLRKAYRLATSATP